MVDYDPLIPQANELISESQADILNNFSELNTIFNNDHFTWNSSPNTKRGFHRQITFSTKLTADPGLGANDGILFPKQDPNDNQLREQLYFINPTNTIQITNRFRSAPAGADGYWMMPGGSTGTPALIYMWGKVTFNVAAVQVLLPTIANFTGGGYISGFPNNIFQVQVTVQNAAANATVRFCIADGSTPGNPFNKTEFWIYQAGTSTNNTAFWFAIGN